MGARRGKAGAAGALVAVILAACTSWETAAPPAVVTAAPPWPPAAHMGVRFSLPPATLTPPAAPAGVVVPAPAPAPPPAPTYLAPGAHERQVDIDGVGRRWTIVVPSGPPATAVMVVLHGVGGRGADMRSTGFEPLAAGRGVVLAYPDALGGAWNDGRPGADPIMPGAAVDDGRFLRTLIDETVARTGADAGRVAVVGFSNGAVMASRLACDLADRVSAVALIAGTAGQGVERSCRPSRPLAVMIAAGVSDSVVPYAGGRIANWGTKHRGYLAGVDELFTFWRAHNGCANTWTAGFETWGTDCRNGTSVVRYRVSTGVHEWYRAPRFDTTAVVWDFVQRRFSPTG